MSTLPVFPVVKRAFVFLGLNLGVLLRLYAIALGLILAAVFLAVGGYAIAKTWLVVLPCVIFGAFAIAPCMMRTYQLAALGEMDPSSYLSSIFTSQSLRYVGYSVLVNLIMLVGLSLSLLPAFLTGALGVGAVVALNKSLSILVSIGLVITFLVLIGPINLIYPAVSLERAPSLSHAYALGAHCKVRLFLVMAVPGLLFGLLGQLVEMIGGVYGVAENVGKVLLMAPLHLTLVFMSTVINAAVFGLAYRFLRGLPHHDPAGPLPGEGPAWPVNAGPGGPDPFAGPESGALVTPAGASAPEAGPAANVQSAPDAGPAPAAATPAPASGDPNQAPPASVEAPHDPAPEAREDAASTPQSQTGQPEAERATKPKGDGETSA